MIMIKIIYGELLMIKRISFISVLIVILISLLAGCKEPQIQVDEEFAKSITVKVVNSLNEDVNITHYIITLINDVSEIKYSSDYLSIGFDYTVTDVPSGNWMAIVEAFAEGEPGHYVKIATAKSETIDVEVGTEEIITVELDELIQELPPLRG